MKKYNKEHQFFFIRWMLENREKLGLFQDSSANLRHETSFCPLFFHHWWFLFLSANNNADWWGLTPVLLTKSKQVSQAEGLQKYIKPKLHHCLSNRSLPGALSTAVLTAKECVDIVFGGIDASWDLVWTILHLLVHPRNSTKQIILAVSENVWISCFSWRGDFD